MYSPKKIVLAISAMLFVVAVSRLNQSFANNGKKGIHFQQGGWKEITDMARTQNKLIFLEFYATWCGPCKRMKSITFTNENVGQFFNTHFVNVAYDAEKGEGLALSKRYEVRSYPTLLIVDAEGNIKTRKSGYLHAKALLKLGESQIN